MRSSRRVRELLLEFERASVAHARQLADRLRQALRATSGVSRALFTDVESAFAARGMRLDASWAPTQLGVGQTWLLLGHPHGGAVARIEVARRDDPVRGPTVPGAEHRRAYESLVTALRARGAAPASAVRDDELRVVGDLGARDLLSGDSLGLPLCVALVSAWLDRAPDTAIAGTAEVLPGGALRPVNELPAKLAALAKAWPNVRRVVVASGQLLPPAPLPGGITPIETSDVLSALQLFGLEVTAEALPPRSRIDLDRRLADFGLDHDAGPPTGGWAARAREAWMVAEAYCHAGEPYRQAQALSWAMLSALYAGDPEAADAFRRAIPLDVTDDMDESARIWYWLGSASTKIDTGELGEAQALAQQAVAYARNVPHAVHRELYGRALGTLGRAWMHAGAYARALPLLREAVGFHAAHMPVELARSRSHLATCQRLAGDATGGLATADDGIADVRLNARTAAFLHLERGRCLVELGRHERAREAFEHVIAGQAADRDYPRLSARRGLARALRGLGDSAGADDALRECLAVAADASVPITLRQVAALAAGEAVLDASNGLGSSFAERDLRRAWDAHLPPATSAEDLRRAIAAVVY